MKIYINGLGNISPQPTEDNEVFLEEIIGYETPYLQCIEPAYKTYINARSSRRLGRFVKMGVVAAMLSLKDAEVEVPDAIITGTGLGCVENTDKFLTSLIVNDEQFLNPTPFIQSTHNTLSAQVALLLKCTAYNFTYVHRGFSFESALLDSLMMIEEGDAHNVLIGGGDEITPNYHTITTRLGHWKREAIPSLELLEHSSKGSMAGEGNTFFLLSDKKGKHPYATVDGISTLYKPEGNEEVEKHLQQFLAHKNLTISDIDLVILGINGDETFDGVYDYLRGNYFQGKAQAYFKHLCGDYQTATTFGMWLGAQILQKQRIPKAVRLTPTEPDQIRRVLIYNHYRGINHSFLLLSAC